MEVQEVSYGAIAPAHSASGKDFSLEIDIGQPGNNAKAPMLRLMFRSLDSPSLLNLGIDQRLFY